MNWFLCLLNCVSNSQTIITITSSITITIITITITIITITITITIRYHDHGHNLLDEVIHSQISEEIQWYITTAKEWSWWLWWSWWWWFLEIVINLQHWFLQMKIDWQFNPCLKYRIWNILTWWEWWGITSNDGNEQFDSEFGSETKIFNPLPP